MADPLEDVWVPRDFPVLREATQRIDRGEGLVTIDTIAQALGMPESDVQLAAKALQRRGLIETMGAWQGIIGIREVSGAAYLITGLHPDGDDALSNLVQALQQAAEQADDDEERSRLRRAADGLLGVSRSVMSGVLTAYLTSQLPH